MDRRRLLKYASGIPLLPLAWPFLAASASSEGTLAPNVFRRVRPADPTWPSPVSWEKLNQDVDGRLIKVRPLLASCADASGKACQDLLNDLQNPYYVGDQPAGTQTAGWLDAWMSVPSVYAVAAKTTSNVVAAVNFARENKLRLVVKGGGHSYQGTSDAADSLLIWTRAMDGIVLHDTFLAEGCAGRQAPQPAVTIGAGAIWMHTYEAVTTRANRYVQGGGCATVGVAGLIQSGGFGSFSKNYGTAAGGLLEAEIVTADGQVRIANACTNEDLFWGIKGGGGGSLGVVTRLTLRTRELPAFFGSIIGKIKASSDEAFRRLIGKFLSLYADALMNPHWGENVTFGTDSTFAAAMVFQGLNQEQAQGVWRPFMDWITASPGDFTITIPFKFRVIPAHDWWNAKYIKENWPDRGFFDTRPGAAEGNFWFAEQPTELGLFIHGFQSVWLPASLLQKDQLDSFAEGLFAATRHWAIGLHFNKGLAGAKSSDVEAARDTAMNPAVLTSFALAIIAGGKPGAYKDLLEGPVDLATARHNAAAIGKAGDQLRKMVPNAGSYVSESNYFEPDWQHSFWGSNYPRLRAVKTKYDPAGLFFVHHGVGSEDWSADGFTCSPCLAEEKR
jgi:FAD/FMN-containing dehydrogenase